ncbi:hypothetical protein CLV62_101551 [Dysgonomonas alginatilytica]|uniref:Uncharacterized protein n=1 Tax=Dysgonomonas alginatilytica TaxID=1605892 RepID=A0A2V3PVX5_9BACT|nr:pyocin knob domain-containing protein [Dysgonomonas alginatilytica]PXV69282.1 hypothetical protein CLV62_101551 [Dysgonomonas alginatilytica]
MKKYIILAALIIVALIAQSQTLNTGYTTDWNSIINSGFYQSSTINTANSPDSKNAYYWGVSISHDDPRYKGQLAFAVNYGLGNPQMYIRSTNISSSGVWAKVITSKGDQAIAGKLKVEEIEVTINTGADHVFYNNYELKPLSELEAFINENKHLPEIPSEKHMQENGLNMNEFQIKLLQKIEELTLYIINQDKKIEEQSKEIETLKSIVSVK